jgi:lysozyme
LKKQSKSWNTFYLLSSGVLIVYAVSRFIKMRRSAIPKPTKGNKLNNNTLSFDELYKYIKSQEGVNFFAVPDGKTKDGKQLYSIGLGHQIQPNEPELLTASLNDQQILDLFKKDSEKIRSSMNRVIKVPLNKNQQLALFSLRYNIGEGAFNGSTLLKKLNANDYMGASLEFSKWRIFEGKVNRGLVARRERERILFNTPI